MKKSNQLWRSVLIAAITVAAALLAVTTATFAWYVYNTTARTTQVKMAAGSSVALQISSTPEGPYSSSAVMQSFTGLLEPVSTNRIQNGFQKVTEFAQEEDRLVASIFQPSTESVDYYKTALYLKTTAPDLDIYLSDISFEDASAEHPISTALRLGIVVDGLEFIFQLNPARNPNADDNAAKEPDGGYVLDSSKDDGSTLPFTPLGRENLCTYNRDEGTVTLNPGSTKLCTLHSDGSGAYGDYKKLDIYLWLEGCDEDCTRNLAAQTLHNLALGFAGYQGGT